MVFRGVFAFMSIVLVAVFMAVNLVLLPFAYLKTIVHKIRLFRIYRGSEHLKNVFVFILVGIPILLIA